MSEVVTAEQIEAFRTNGFIVVDDLLTDAELDTFEPLVTAAVAYRSAGDERTLEEGGAGGSPVVPAATHAVDENDVLDLGHTTKGDSHSPGEPEACVPSVPPACRALRSSIRACSAVRAGRLSPEYGMHSAILRRYQSQPLPKSMGPTGYGRDGYSGRETTGGELTIPTWPGRWHTVELPVLVH
jgi:hypothetical protein